MKQAEKDSRDGYAQGFQDARDLRLGYQREPAMLRAWAKLCAFPGAYRNGYDQGRREGLHSTLRIELPPKRELLAA